MGPIRRLSPGFLLTLAALAAIPLAIALADRSIASFMFHNAHDSRAPYVALTHIVDGLEILASLGLAWSFWVFSRRGALGTGGRIAVRTALALFSALGVKEVLKLAFGRTWPETFTCGNPSFIRDAAFGFTPFHGGAGWASFPSGHETVVCAVAGCLWVMTPRLRPLCLLASVLVALGLLVADYHWFSDILAGALVGWTLGVFVAKVDLAKVAAPA